MIRLLKEMFLRHAPLRNYIILIGRIEPGDSAWRFDAGGIANKNNSRVIGLLYTIDVLKQI